MDLLDAQEATSAILYMLLALKVFFRSHILMYLGREIPRDVF